MDRLMDVAPSEQVREIERAFAEQVMNEELGVVFFPVRHHSPACSHHLLAMIGQYRPDIILIEGPVNATELIPILTDEATVPPVSLYCTFESEEGKAAYYYPLLSYSPEYVAMKEAARRGIPARFIDLDDYGRRVAGEHKEGEQAEQASAQDETLLAGSQFMEALCSNLNCRSFDELWEKMVEINGLVADTREFVRIVFTYCTLSRMCYSDEQLGQFGDLEREAHMRACIAQAVAEHGRVLVVTGGFHTYALLPPYPSSGEPAGRASSDRALTAAYPMVYTFMEADRLNGYASGMPYVNYYDQIWNQMHRKRKSEPLQLREQPYTDVAASLLAQLARQLRKSEEAVSTSDAIEAYRMLHGLAELRGKREGGVFELQDAALSAFVKGEHTLATDQPLQQLALLLTGDKIGTVAPNKLAVPIVEDFKARSAQLKLQLNVTGKHSKTLDIYAKPQHRLLSQWFHCISFLVGEFATRQAGPDWVAYKDMNLVRESWSYSYSSRIEARFIECSIYGGTVREAVARKLQEQALAIPEHHSSELVGLLLQAGLMGLQESVRSLYERVEQALHADAHFLSICRSLNTLVRMRQHSRLLGLSDDGQLPRLAQEAYRMALLQLPHLTETHADEQPAVAQSLQLLSMLAGSEPERYDGDGLHQQLDELLDMAALPPLLEGSAIAIAAALGSRSREEIMQRAKGYIRGTPDKAKQSALYLQGVCASARDVFLYDSRLLSELNHLIGELPYDDFIAMVPELRLAFTHFTPVESSLIAEKVAALHETTMYELELPAVKEQALIEARRMDEAIRKEFAAWKLI